MNATYQRKKDNWLKKRKEYKIRAGMFSELKRKRKGNPRETTGGSWGPWYATGKCYKRQSNGTQGSWEL